MDGNHAWLLSASLVIIALFAGAVYQLTQDLEANWRGVVRGVRGSALRWPLHPWQLGAGFIVFVNTLTFYGVTSPALTNNYTTLKPAGGGLFWDVVTVLHLTAATAFWFLLVYLELFDPSAEGYTQPEVDGEAGDTKLDESSGLLRTSTNVEIKEKAHLAWTAAHPWCYCASAKDQKKCEKFYPGRYRYHCRSCNRCTTGFDHHCRYLNQCICAANYRPWVCFIVALFVQSLTQAIVSVSCIIAASEGDVPLELHKWGLTTLVTLSVLTLVIQIAAAGFTTQLMGIHLILMRLQMNTGKYVTTHSWWGNDFADGKQAEELEMALWQLFRAQDAKNQLKMEEMAAAGEAPAESAGDAEGSIDSIRDSQGIQRSVTEAYKGDEEEQTGKGRVFGKQVVDPNEVIKRWFTNMKHSIHSDSIKKEQMVRTESRKEAATGFSYFTRLILGDDSVDDWEHTHDGDTDLKGEPLKSVATK